MLQSKIQDVFQKHPEIIFGFTDISYSSYADDYASALVFAVPYGEQLSTETYTEEKFEMGIRSTRSVLEDVVALIEEVLQEHGAKYWVPPVAQENEEELRGLVANLTSGSARVISAVTAPVKV